MLYEEDHILPYKMVVNRGGRSGQETNLRSAFTQKQLEAIAPHLTRRQVEELRTNLPCECVRDIIAARVKAAKHLKYGDWSDGEA